MRRISVAMRRMSLALDLCDADEALPLLAFLTLELRQVRQARLGWRERKTFQSGLDRIGRHGPGDPLGQLPLAPQWRGGLSGGAAGTAMARKPPGIVKFAMISVINGTFGYRLSRAWLCTASALSWPEATKDSPAAVSVNTTWICPAISSDIA